MASVVPRKNRNGTTTFQVKTRHAGRQVSESFTSVVIARQFAALVEKHGWEAATAIRDDRTNSPRNRAPITLNEWFAQWIEYLPGVTGGTAIDYKRMANRTWLVDLGDYPVDSIKRDHVLKWLATYRTTPTAKTGRPPAANTIANAHALLFTVMAAAVEANHAPTNPCRGIRLPKSEHVESTFLTLDELLAADEITAVRIAEYLHADNALDDDILAKVKSAFMHADVMPSAWTDFGTPSYIAETALPVIARLIALRWVDARNAERDAAADAKDAIVALAASGVPETRIALVMAVDRMTVRRALGKL